MPTYRTKDHDTTVTQRTKQHQRTAPEPTVSWESKSSTESGGVSTRTANESRSTCFFTSSYSY